jgi:hypothetical protein
MVPEMIATETRRGPAGPRAGRGHDHEAIRRRRRIAVAIDKHGLTVRDTGAVLGILYQLTHQMVARHCIAHLDMRPLLAHIWTLPDARTCVKVRENGRKRSYACTFCTKGW